MEIILHGILKQHILHLTHNFNLLTCALAIHPLLRFSLSSSTGYNAYGTNNTVQVSRARCEVTWQIPRHLQLVKREGRDGEEGKGVGCGRGVG